ncbi:MAG: NAD(P)/FAD-dependent oxidoreductase [Bacteroidia bacterium]|nr:NAD(P)/FAD-dependent oxidoreductase [Bacteroidia bacterium]
MQNRNHYDLIVIGGGPGGYAGAMRALDFGKRVLLVEKNKLGGAGIYDGVLTSKTLWELAMRTLTFREINPEFIPEFESINQIVKQAIFERKSQLQIHSHLLSVRHQDLFKYIRGKASFMDPHTIEITLKDGSTLRASADFFLIATGSTPRIPKGVEVDEQFILTSNGIKNLTSYPKSMVIVGAGVIGCEFATIFSILGKTKVYLIDKAERILPFEDEDISVLIEKHFNELGVHIHHGSQWNEIKKSENGVVYTLSEKDGNKKSYQVEKCLISIGREAWLKDLCIENAGLKINERGGLWDYDTQTNVSHIYTAGDVSTDVALVNVAEREGRHAVVRMFGHSVPPINYNNVSTIMFLYPEVGAVGMNELQCRQKGIPHKVVKIDYSLIARAIAMRKTKGFFKIIVSNDHSMRILGMRAVGEHASSAIQAIAYLIHQNKGIRELADMLHPHPSIIEGIQECLRMLLQKSIYKPEIFEDKMQCYTWENDKITPIHYLLPDHD